MKDRFKLVMPWVLSVFILIAVVAVQCVVLSAKIDLLDAKFWTSLVVNVGIIIMVSVVWLFYGRDQAAKIADGVEKTSYQIALEDYAFEVDRVQNGRISEFTIFCARKTEEMRTRTEDALLRSVCMDRIRYEVLREKPSRDLKKLGLSRKQIAVILRIASGKIRVRTVQPVGILTDSKIKEKDGYGVDFNESADVAISIAWKSISAIVMSVILTALFAEVVQNIKALDVWVMFAMKLVLVVWNSWSGYITGYGMISERKKKVLRKRVDFIKMFFEQAGE